MSDKRPLSTETLCPVILFSGKGGVGKTTLAAATAVRLAEGGSRVLLVSTDPAHSLSDVFDLQLSSRPRRVLDTLDAMEIDAGGMFSEALDAGASPGEDSGEGGALARMMRMATQTPGVDEFGAIEVLLQAVEGARHDVVILDTAPTGHTLRLLMLPELLDGWLGTLFQLRNRIARAGRLLRKLWPSSGTSAVDGQTFEKGLNDSRDRIAALRDLLTDSERAQIMLVTIPEAMSVLETLRTLKLLRSQRLPVGSIVVNQMQPAKPDCVYCSRRRAIHDGQLAGLRERAGDVPLRVVESVDHEIRGIAELRRLADTVWSSDDEPEQREAHRTEAH